MSKMIFVNLPARDLAALTRFYLALGGTLNPQFSGEQSSSIMFSDAIGVMLLTHNHYRQFTQRPIGDARRESQAMIALTADSKTRNGAVPLSEQLAKMKSAFDPHCSAPVASITSTFGSPVPSGFCCSKK